jgi:hypothetical protein
VFINLIEFSAAKATLTTASNINAAASAATSK